jgi:hypothetical protein
VILYLLKGAKRELRDYYKVPKRSLGTSFYEYNC